MTKTGTRTSPASLVALGLVGLLMIAFALNVRDTNSRNHRSLIASCERGNLLREEVANNIGALQQVLDFTSASIEHSIAVGDIPAARAKAAHASAATYLRISRSLRVQPQVDCGKAFP